MTSSSPETTTPPALVLVPGHWLGAWAWDAVAEDLRDRGHDVWPVTLPGLDPADPDRSRRTLDDQVEALATVIEGAGAGSRPVVLVVHSGAGFPASALLDQDPGAVARVVYVDSGPVGDGTAFLADLPPDVAELPLPPYEQLGQQASLEGLDATALTTFRDRAVPEPGPVLRAALMLGDEKRRDVPTTLVCCSWPAEQVLAMAHEGHPLMAEVAELSDLELRDLPTGHWPMWSRPADLAAEISVAAGR